MQSVKLEDTKIRIPILVSYFGIKDNYKAPTFASKVMLDSGAYSAWNQKKTIDIDAFIDYCLKFSKKFSCVISLDVIHNAKQSWENYKKMAKAGVKCIPVYHATEDIKYLYKYADITNYIGIGGIAKAVGTRVAQLQKLFTLFPDPKKIGFHGFGVNERKLIRGFPWKTLDASSAHLHARFGMVDTPWGTIQIIPYGNNHKFLNCDLLESKRKQAILDYIKQRGYNEKVSQETTVAGIKERCLVNIDYFEQIRLQCPEYYISKINYIL